MLAKTGTSSRRRAPLDSRAPEAECTQLALDALLAAEEAASRRPPFRVTPAHVLVGLMRQRRSSAAELLAANGFSEDRVWAAFDYRRWGGHGVRRLRDPVLGHRPRWSRAAREVVANATRKSRQRVTSVVDTVDLLSGIGEVGDAFAAHLLAAARLDTIMQDATAREAHLIELERSPTTQLPGFTTVGKLHV